MCVIIHKPKDVTFPEEDIRLAFENNPHGFGYVYYDPELDHMKCEKSVDYKIEDILKIFKDLVPYETVFHFRWKTHGAQTDKECHPFRILSKKHHNFDMFMTHNGVISGMKIKDNNESDTQAFIRAYIKPLMKVDPMLLEMEPFQEMLYKYIGTSNKLCFMYGKGDVMIINPSAGAQRHGCWVSNEYSFRASYRAPTQTNSFSSTYYYRGVNRTNQQGTSQSKVDEGKFLDETIKVGSPMLIFGNYNKDFHTVGRVTKVSAYTTFITFTCESGEERDLAFDNRTGESYANNGRWSAILTDEMVVDNSKVILLDQYKDKQEQKKSPSETQKTSQVLQKETPTNPADSKTCGDGATTIVSANQTSTEVVDVSEFIEPVVGQDGNTFDAKDRFGGAFLTRESSYWGVTSENFMQMTPQDRFLYFIDNPEVCFLMLQDAFEYLTMEEEEFENISFYEEEEPNAPEHIDKLAKRILN